jgi:hypothetical protein
MLRWHIQRQRQCAAVVAGIAVGGLLLAAPASAGQAAFTPSRAAADQAIVDLASRAAAPEVPGVYADPSLPPGWIGRVGVPVTFTFKPGKPGDCVAAYQYGLLGDTPLTVAAGAHGAVTVTVTPTQQGTNQLTVRAANRSGTLSEPAGFIFRVSGS